MKNDSTRPKCKSKSDFLMIPAQEYTQLLELRNEVIKWAKTPGNHGGNPYMHKFVKMAMELAGE